MTDFIFKLAVLIHFIRDACTKWHSEIWVKDIDSLYCCDGRWCCCGGITIREVHERIIEGEPHNE